MTICDELRQAVLQAAIQGKLTEQREEDGTAEELLEEIRKEKEKLIKDGKIKKGKKLPEITTEEIPFDIPENWKWVRLVDLGSTYTGNTPSKTHLEYFGNFIPFIGPGDIQNCMIRYDKQGLSEIGMGFGRTVEAGSILQVCIGGSIGKCAIAKKAVAFNQQINAVTPVFANSEYLFFVLCGEYFTAYLKEHAGGTATPIINRGIWDTIVVPLPPLAEQHRIVERVNTLMKKIDVLQTIEDELQSLKQALPGNMRDAILQAAMQGKLTEQLESDGTAEELLEEIKQEKEKLIKEGKIKKEKTLPEISEDEIPFDIPENWKWVRLGEVGQMYGGGTPKTHVDEYWRNGTISWITPADMNYEERYISKGRKSITQDGLDNSSAQLFPKGSVIISSRAPIGYVMIAQNDATTSQGCKTFSAYSQQLADSEFIYYLMRFRTPDLILRASGTTFKEISGRGIGETVIPLPPLAEQHRIVARLNELLPLCDTLEEAK